MNATALRTATVLSVPFEYNLWKKFVFKYDLYAITQIIHNNEK